MPGSVVGERPAPDAVGPPFAERIGEELLQIAIIILILSNKY